MTPPNFTLTVVDQSPIRYGGTAADALRESVRLAQAAERFGYARYWVTEHHDSPGLAGSAPEILIGQIAANTRSIRVGSAGVMLSHYSALKVAETFRILAAFYPGRIDLGIGRAPGSDQRTAWALAYPRQVADVLHTFPRQVVDVVGFLNDKMAPEHPFAPIKAQPGEAPEGVPEVWLLGSSDYSAQLAAQLGLPFAFADFFGRSEGDFGPQVAELYRREFEPSEYLREPKCNVTLQVFCAPTDAEAELVAASTKLTTTRRRINFPDRRLLAPEVAAKLLTEPPIAGRVEGFTQHMIVGSPDTVVKGVLAAAERYVTTDIGISANTFNFADRVRSFELVAEAFGLPRRDGAVAGMEAAKA